MENQGSHSSPARRRTQKWAVPVPDQDGSSRPLDEPTQNAERRGKASELATFASPHSGPRLGRVHPGLRCEKDLNLLSAGGIRHRRMPELTGGVEWGKRHAFSSSTTPVGSRSWLRQRRLAEGLPLTSLLSASFRVLCGRILPSLTCAFLYVSAHVPIPPLSPRMEKTTSSFPLRGHGALPVDPIRL